MELCRLHQAAGAVEVLTAHASELRWRSGEDFEAFADRVDSASYDPNDVACFTAPRWGHVGWGRILLRPLPMVGGELHDVRGVWIGDGSAFPTAPGVNPMISIMSLAHRTAGELLGGSK